MSNVLIRIQESSSKVVTIAVPDDMNLSLMEVLKMNGYDQIQATCGGIAMCGTCHVRVLNHEDMSLVEPPSEEWAMLDTLPDADPETSRLSCQMRINQTLNNILIKIPE